MQIFCETCQTGYKAQAPNEPLPRRLIDAFLRDHNDHRLRIEARAHVKKS
jgi:hypothetical protein